MATPPDPTATTVRYDGEFWLAWLRAGERVMSAGDGTGAAIIVSADGSERRVNIGDELEIPTKSGPGQAPSSSSRRPASETETAGASSSTAARDQDSSSEAVSAKASTEPRHGIASDSTVATLPSRIADLKATLRIAQLDSNDDTNPTWDDFDQALATVDALLHSRKDER